jgi:hypothetical protein
MYMPSTSVATLQFYSDNNAGKWNLFSYHFYYCRVDGEYASASSSITRRKMVDATLSIPLADSPVSPLLMLLLLGAFGGLMVSALASGTQVRGFKRSQT